ncbi:MAG: hypothetical protein A2W25_12575 [candidate division Zixibacteria bacterium RBG_16_53_22]|nr:MAG: hypothetical protein A2W25_12575 [candidate division Zixibacteria bacterium RBG_16_53_22]
MFFVKDHKTRDIFDPLARFGPHRRDRLEKSWAKLFREEILPVLPVHKLFPHYSGVTGSPTKDLYAMLGVMLLQQVHDLTDEEAVDQVAFNLKWQYALGISEEKEKEAYVCPKTLWPMRDILARENLSGVIFETVTDKLVKLFCVDTTRCRLDSVHIFSNMRHLGRIGLFVRGIKTFLVNLKRHHGELFAALAKEMTEKYLSKSGESVFSMVKSSESERTLAALGDDLFFLAERFRQVEAVAGMSSYKVLLRVLREQCTVEEAAGTKGKTVRIKPNKEIASDSLQNPSDPDATYCGHKGQGYQAQVMETYCPAPTDEDDQTQGKGLSLITHVSVEPAHAGDAHALLPAIKDVEQCGLAPKEILADSLYGSEKSVAAAAAMGTEVVAPVPGGEKKSKSSLLSEFTLTEEGGIERCPMGHTPIEDAARGNHREVVFAVNNCFRCSRRKECPVKSVRCGYGFSYDKKQVKMARRRAAEKTASFRDRYRYRSGIEGAFSALDRLTGMKQLRVRGMKAVRYCVTLKAAGVNLFRAVAAWNPERGGKPAGSPPITGICGLTGHLLHGCVRLARSLHGIFSFGSFGHPILAASAA